MPVERDGEAFRRFERKEEFALRRRVHVEAVLQDDRDGLLPFLLLARPGLDHHAAAQGNAQRLADAPVEAKDFLRALPVLAVDAVLRFVEHEDVPLGERDLPGPGCDRDAAHGG